MNVFFHFRVRKGGQTWALTTVNVGRLVKKDLLLGIEKKLKNVVYLSRGVYSAN